ncbi:MAG: nucleotidyl transferase AbiEii/AbiGii toxin family protein [Candidatus Delongbacteria bacterium]
MIPQAFIREWSQYAPWKSNEQIEQDLLICRALVEIFSDEWLSERLAFRGGTALHKLYLSPQTRYSEDIDLVQITSEPFGQIIDKIRERLVFLGIPIIKQKESNNTLNYRFESEYPPVQKLKLKVETNCREHFTVLGYEKFPFAVNSPWFSGKCDITTYHLEELLGTKLRALYQRSKGRDLYDLYLALTKAKNLDKKVLLDCYKKYMSFSVQNPPSMREFRLNIESKMKDDDFIGDTAALLSYNYDYDPFEAYEIVLSELLS